MPLYVLQELGSWECVEMVRKYAHLASDHLVQYVDRMSGLHVVQEGKWLRFRLQPPNEKGLQCLQALD
jgi:hypothetical protein